MTAPFFVDTNVLAYVQDRGQGDKQLRAREWVDAILAEALPSTSFQVLVELYNVLTRKLAHPLVAAEARRLVSGLMSWAPITPSQRLFTVAWEIEDRFGLSWWDAQIVAAAQLQGCAFLLTEDLQHGQRFGDVTIVNPFEATPAEVLAR